MRIAYISPFFYPYCMTLARCILFGSLLLFAFTAIAQWPKEIKAKNGAIITVYQPQPETLNGNRTTGRAAFSAVEKAGSEPLFGVFWYTANITTDRDTRMITLESIKIDEVKLPGIADETQLSKLKQLLEQEIPTWGLSSSLDDLTATLEQEQALVSENLKNDPPVIYYTKTPTTLVLVDGEPKLQPDDKLKMNRVVNSAFLIVENPEDKKYYLYGGQFWYASPSLKDGYTPVSTLPKAIATIDQQLKKSTTEKGQKPDGGPPAVLVSTVPAEVIQSTGDAKFANITGTSLLYVSNSPDDIFKNISDQNYYVLLAGRWYASAKLEGPWTFVASDKLPADFGKIPEGSDKDNVLAFVAGTPASQDAIRDAQVPQTAKVDRKKATTSVSYDGEPKFEKIEGTSLELAMNTSSTVIKSGSQYFCVDKGVWFAAASPQGPWSVSDSRPKEVESIPASSPAYNVKYVYVYDATPDVVYVGYTPGYMGCYVYGPTVVYGTGYYYSPWYGPYYYPRPVTYGFSMHYNPWTGWSMGFHYSYGWFSFSMYGGGGYWGPPYHRPPYYPPYRGGMYGGRGPTYINGDVNINIDRSNNIYNRRNDVSTRDVKRTQPSVGTRDQVGNNRRPQPSTQPANAGPRKDNNVYSDRNGNVYQRDNGGNWNQRDGDKWQQPREQPSNMNRDYQNRQRSVQNNSNFNNMNRGGNMGGAYQGGGGASRGGGGGGRRR